MRERLHGPRDVRRVGREIGEALEPLDLRLEDVTAREPIAEQRVRENRASWHVLATALRNLHVVRDRIDHLREGERLEGRLDLRLERLHELLLPRDAVEVGVGVAVANEVERSPPGEPLVAGAKVDRRVAERAAAVVEIPSIDVHPSAPEPVHDLTEASEVDGNQVVHLEAGQGLHGVEGALRPALLVRVRDLVEVRQPARAPDLDAHVSRKRQERDRIGVRIGAHEHQRVRARRRSLAVREPVVVTDHERKSGLAGKRHLERSRRALHRGILGCDGGNRLVEVEVGTTRCAGDDHERRDTQPQRDLTDEANAGTTSRRRLPVDADGRVHARRQNGSPVPVRRRCTPEASLQGRSHENEFSNRRAPRQAPDASG